MAIPQFRSMAERVELFQQFYHRANERALLGFFVGSEYPLWRYPASRSLPENRPLAPDDFDVSDYLDDCERLFADHEACRGDFIWTASAFWGIPWLEAILGCALWANHATGSVYSQPPARFRGVQDVPEFNPDSPWMHKCAEFIDVISCRSAGRWPLGTTRMRGISDLLAALYGPTDWIYAMLDRPEEIHAVCARLTSLWVSFAQFQLRHIPEFYGGIGSFYYHLWAPPGTVWHQEDAAALLSPELYAEFIREHDLAIARAFPCVMHQHPTAFVPTDFYLDMPFIALELHVDAGGPSARALFEQHRRILAAKPLVIWGSLSQQDMDWIFSRLPSKGLAVITTVTGPEQAAGIWERYM